MRQSKQYTFQSCASVRMAGHSGNGMVVRQKILITGYFFASIIAVGLFCQDDVLHLSLKNQISHDEPGVSFFFHIAGLSFWV